MGMYDYIDVPAHDCKSCGADLKNRWQTKDAKCLLETVNYKDVNFFYGTCPECETWHEYNRKSAKTLDDFNLTVEKKEF